MYKPVVNNISRSINNAVYEEVNNNTTNDSPTYNILKRSKHYDKDIYEQTRYDKLERGKLPEGWLELFDEKTKKYYYACIYTQHTQWLNPTIPIGKMMPNGLPYGWEKEWDEKNQKFFYINHVGRFNTWNPPIKQRSYKGDNYKW